MAASVEALHLELQSRAIVVPFEVGNAPGVFEDEFPLRAADHAAAREHEKRGRRRLDQTLQPIPSGGGNFSQFLRRVEHEIEHHEREIAVAQEEVGGFYGVECFRAANPEQMTQPRRSRSGGSKRIAAIDQGHEITIARGDMKKLVKQEGAACAEVGTAQLGDGALGQSAFGCDIEGGKARGEVRGGAQTGDGEAFLEELAKIDNFAARSHVFKMTGERNMFKRTLSALAPISAAEVLSYERNHDPLNAQFPRRDEIGEKRILGL